MKRVKVWTSLHQLTLGILLGVSLMTAMIWYAVPAKGQQQVQPVAGVLTLNLVPGTTAFKVILSANVTSVVIVNPTPGTIISVIFTENATGGFTVAFGGNIANPCSVATAANTTTTCQFQYDATSNTWNGIGGSGGVPGQFNVKTYGAKGDTQISTGNCTLVNTQNTLSCTGATFTSIDISKRANCGLSLGGGTFFTAGSTITSIVNSTTAGLSSTANGSSSVASCAWGTPDDANVGLAVTAWLAAIRATPGQGANFKGAIPANPPTLYFPTGGYLLCGTANNSIISTTSSFGGGLITGDAPRESWLVACDNPANPGSLGFFINQQSGGNQLSIKNLAFTSVDFPAGSAIAMLLSGTHLTENLYFTAWNGSNAFSTTGGGYNLNLVVDNSGQGGSPGILCNACNDEFHNGGSSNNGAHVNTLVANAVGLNNGNGPRFFNFLNDECGGGVACFNVTNSHDVWIIGSSLFGTNASSALNVDANSFVHLEGGIVGVFGNDTNATGLSVAAGGLAQTQDVRFVSTGTGKCINNSGIVNDNGGNTCESQFPIASGTSTGTTAVLTLTNVGAAVNANCSVGDALVVQGANIAGYDGYYAAGATTGITAVTATTLTYTTIGSNLGALGAGGTAYCRNLQTFTGNLPKALLNNPIPNTCYITGTFAATTAAAPMCAFKLGSATNITAIKATSTTTTACTVAPVVTISDGTVSETLTITTAKSIWDSSVDASTGVGTSIFKPNGTITLSNTVGTCTTPPTNFGVSYNISPILSN